MYLLDVRLDSWGAVIRQLREKYTKKHSLLKTAANRPLKVMTASTSIEDLNQRSRFEGEIARPRFFS